MSLQKQDKTVQERLDAVETVQITAEEFAEYLRDKEQVAKQLAKYRAQDAGVSFEARAEALLAGLCASSANFAYNATRYRCVTRERERLELIEEQVELAKKHNALIEYSEIFSERVAKCLAATTAREAERESMADTGSDSSQRNTAGTATKKQGGAVKKAKKAEKVVGEQATAGDVDSGSDSAQIAKLVEENNALKAKIEQYERQACGAWKSVEDDPPPCGTPVLVLGSTGTVVLAIRSHSTSYYAVKTHIGEQEVGWLPLPKLSESLDTEWHIDVEGLINEVSGVDGTR